MPRIRNGSNDPLDFCWPCFPSEEEALELYGAGEGPDNRDNCFCYDDDHPPYEGEDYECHTCGQPLGEDDNSWTPKENLMPPYIEALLWVVAPHPDQAGLTFARVLTKREFGPSCYATIDETPANQIGLLLLGGCDVVNRNHDWRWWVDAEQAGIGETKEQALQDLIEKYQYRIQENLDEVAQWQKQRQAAATLLQELSEPAGVVV